MIRITMVIWLKTLHHGIVLEKKTGGWYVRCFPFFNDSSTVLGQSWPKLCDVRWWGSCSQNLNIQYKFLTGIPKDTVRKIFELMFRGSWSRSLIDEIYKSHTFVAATIYSFNVVVTSEISHHSTGPSSFTLRRHIKSCISQHHYTTLGKQRDIKWTSLIEPNLLDISIHIVILHVEGQKTLGTVVYWPVYAYQNTFTPFHLRWRVQISGVPTNDPTHHRRRRHDQVAHPSFLLADEKQKGSGRLDRSEKTQSNLRLRKQSTC